MKSKIIGLFFVTLTVFCDVIREVVKQIKLLFAYSFAKTKIQAYTKGGDDIIHFDKKFSELWEINEPKMKKICHAEIAKKYSTTESAVKQRHYRLCSKIKKSAKDLCAKI